MSPVCDEEHTLGEHQVHVTCDGRDSPKLIQVLAFAVALVVVWGTIVPGPAFAADKAAERAQSQAKDMGRAWIRGDIDHFADYIQPRLFEMAGGKAKFIQTVRTFMAGLAAKGLSIRSTTAAAPQQIVRPRPRMVQVIIPIKAIAVGGGYEVRQSSYLFGLSNDSGQTWKFVDTGGLGRGQLRKLFPECSPELKIPESQDMRVRQHL